MVILALDAVSTEVTASLWEDDKSLSFKKAPFTAKAASVLPVMVGSILQETGLDFENIDHFVVNKGPGSFTGIRIGLAFTRGLSFGADIKASAIDGFTLALKMAEYSEESNICLILDARRPDFYCQFIINKISQPPVILTLEEIKELYEKQPFSITGNAALLVKQQLQEKGIKIEVIHPLWEGSDAIAHCYMQSPKLFSDLTPYYLRPPDIHVKANVIPISTSNRR